MWLGFHGFAAMRSAVWLLHEQHLGPGAPPESSHSVKLFIVPQHATSGAAPASLPCIPPSSLMFRCALTDFFHDFLPLSVAGELPVPFLAPWSDQGRALRPDQEPADSSCGSQLLPTIDGNAAPVCAAVCAAFVGLVGGCEMGIWEA